MSEDAQGQTPKRVVERAPVPTALSYRRDDRVLEVGYADGGTHELSAEFLRVHSPSAEVRGHGPGQEVLQTGKEDVAIDQIEPIGHYAVRLHFNDGHHTGLYSWDELYKFVNQHDELWRDYLARLEAAGHQRRG